MIVHSSQNVSGGCLVQVEGIEPGEPQSWVQLFATGAAAKHNAGYVVARSKVVEWLDDLLRPLPPGADTSQSTAARVLCEVEKP